MEKLWRILGVLLAAVCLGACGAPQAPTAVGDVPRITVAELGERIDRGEPLIIGDTRSQSAYADGHIPDAISIPVTQVEAYLADLPRDRDIVLYCT